MTTNLLRRLRDAPRLLDAGEGGDVAAVAVCLDPVRDAGAAPGAPWRDAPATLDAFADVLGRIRVGGAAGGVARGGVLYATEAARMTRELARGVDDGAARGSRGRVTGLGRTAGGRVVVAAREVLLCDVGV